MTGFAKTGVQPEPVIASKAISNSFSKSPDSGNIFLAIMTLRSRMLSKIFALDVYGKSFSEKSLKTILETKKRPDSCPAFLRNLI
jgi:hypothetical protein